nr:ATP-binding protein [Kibdelosporangium sp. MJ126-NF4]
MREREQRAIEGISAYLTDTGQTPDPRTLARLIGTETGAIGCELTVASERYLWGEDAGSWSHESVVHAGEHQGILAVSPMSAGPLPAVAAALGAPLALRRLTTDTDRLRRAGDVDARELLDDRWRAAVELEQERRALERDLHDGAQHQLVALRMALALVEHNGDAARERLTDLLSRLDTAERVLVDTAAGILPVVLASEGLAAGLTAELSSHDDVKLDLDGLRRRYSPVAESAVYFACVEAVNNAHKHAPGANITVAVRDSGHSIEFAVVDTGPGFDDAVPNSGLRNLFARAEDAGGTITVRSKPGMGTTVTGSMPY